MTNTAKNTQTNTSMKLERANRVAVQNTDTGYRADFYRTHKRLATLISDECGWTADESMNKSAQREDFRKFAIDHAEDIGIEWNPADLRTEENKRIPKYENDELLMVDAVAMLSKDIYELVGNCPYGIQYKDTEADHISPMYTTAKGTNLSQLGIEEGKYKSTGNWAWAGIDMIVTMTKDEQEIYFTTECLLVSGQLKKPHITQTSFNESIKASLQEAGLWVEESKVEAKAEESAPAPKEEPKAKKSKAKKTSKTENAQA